MTHAFGVKSMKSFDALLRAGVDKYPEPLSLYAHGWCSARSPWGYLLSTHCIRKYMYNVQAFGLVDRSYLYNGGDAGSLGKLRANRYYGYFRQTRREREVVARTTSTQPEVASLVVRANRYYGYLRQTRREREAVARTTSK